MKKFLFILSIIMSLQLATPALAVTTTPTASSSASKSTTPTINPTDPNLVNQINDLKEKIASKVAQLNLVEKRGVIGTIVDTNNTQITLNDLQNNTQFVDVDEITKFSSPSNSNIGISDLTKGTMVSVLGLYNKDSRRILARFVNVMTMPTYLNGTINSLDRVNGQFYITGEDKKRTLIDVESFTKTSTFIKATDLARLGFSKLNVGDRVFIMGYPDKTTPSMLVASRILQLPEVAKDPAITVNVPLSVTPTPTTTAKSSTKTTTKTP